MEKTKAILFDLDGTLWDSSFQVLAAWNSVLSKKAAPVRCVTHKEITSFMGKTIAAIGEMAFPLLPPRERALLMEECCQKETEYLKEHGGLLYPKVKETLALLSKDNALAVVSNCQDGYLEAFLSYYELSSCFKDFETAGRTGKTKGENIKCVLLRNGFEKAVYVGDTHLDKEAAQQAGIPFIYAAYGFGSLQKEPAAITAFEQLAEKAPLLLR